MTKADQINNSWQIAEEFRSRNIIYYHHKLKLVDAAPEKPGPVKIYTREEILNYIKDRLKIKQSLV